MPTYEEKAAALRRDLAALPGALVAFSGGVDSTMLLAAAVAALGPDRVVAVTAVSPTFPAAEREEACALARRFGVRHHLLPTAELDLPGYRRNGPDRCYHCKGALLDRVRGEVAAGVLPDWPVLLGAQLSDLADHRPGERAARDRGALAPLAAAGFTKEEIRQWSRAQRLPTADKPATACLASRIPYGTPITPDLLRQVEAAEDHLRRLGFGQLRVRHHGPVARVELPAADLPRAAGALREEIVAGLKAAGFLYVALDLEGFRSGSLNAALAGPLT